MGLVRRALAVTGWATLGTAVAFTAYTRKSKIYQVPEADYLLGTTIFARVNPNNNPPMKDVCIRQVPIQQIRPELLQQEGRLVEAFCGRLFSGWAYAIQRRFLERKYRDADTAKQLWDAKDIREDRYNVGTVITDHFEVVGKTPNSIILRCGDSPRVNATRESDGLFEMTTNVKRDEGVVEFGMKSVFFNSIAEPDEGNQTGQHPIPAYVEWAHRKYTKILMEDAVRNCTT